MTAGAYVFVQNRMDLSPLPFVAGLRGAGECLISRPDLPVRLHVVPRDPALPARVADGPTRSFEIHTAFAHDGPATGPGAATVEPGADPTQWATAYSAGWDEVCARVRVLVCLVCVCVCVCVCVLVCVCSCVCVRVLVCVCV